MKFILILLIILSAVTVSVAQRSSYQMWFDNNRIMETRIMNDMMNKNMCEEWRRKGEKVPADCSSYTSSGSSTSTRSTASAANTAAKKGLVKFTPIAGDTSFQQYANENGSTAEEKQFLMQISNATKALFEERYTAKGWKNNVAGAFAFFIISNMTVYSGSEPGEMTQNALFESLDAVLSQSPEFVAASNKEKQELYNTLIAYSGFPLTVYADGAQKGDRQQIEKARNLAAGYIRLLLKSEPEGLKGLLEIGSGAATQSTATPRTETRATGSVSINAKYSCLKLTSRNGSAVYDPAGLGFTIAGSSYSVVSGTGGKVTTSGGITQFNGGRLNGWRGEMRNNSGRFYLFFRVNFTEVRPGESARFGDIQCYQQ